MHVLRLLGMLTARAPPVLRDPLASGHCDQLGDPWRRGPQRCLSKGPPFLDRAVTVNPVPARQQDGDLGARDAHDHDHRGAPEYLARLIRAHGLGEHRLDQLCPFLRRAREQRLVGFTSNAESMATSRAVPGGVVVAHDAATEGDLAAFN